MRIGILGGSFDPPHEGHIALAQAAREQLELDEVVLVPAFRNPLKTRRSADARHRLRMTELAAEGEPGLSVSNIEISRGGRSYAVETVEELQYANPGDYWFILGSDALKGIMSWKDPARLVRHARLAVVERRGDALDSVLASLPMEIVAQADRITMPPKAVSSTQVRDDLRRGASVELWLKPEVSEYIKENDLYRD